MPDVPARDLHLKSQMAVASAAVAMVIGLLGLIGWVGDIPVLKSVFPGLATMKVNTALSLFFSGLSLSALDSRFPGRLNSRLIGSAAAAIVTATSILTLCQYAFAIDLGIDQAFVRDTAGAATAFPGRMAPITAAVLLLIGLASLLLHLRRYPGFAQASATLAALIAAIACVSLLYRVDSLAPVAWFSSVAIHTAATLLIISLGLMAASPTNPAVDLLTSKGVGGLMARRLGLAAILIPVVFGRLALYGQESGWYGSEFSIAVTVLCVITGLSTLIVWTTSQVQRAEEKRSVADSALRQSEDQMRTALAAGRMGTWRWDVRSNTSVWNERECELLDMTPADGPISTEAFFRRVHPDDLESLRKTLADAIEQGSGFQMDFRVVRPDGAIRWLAGAGRVRRDPMGLSTEMYGVNFDVTERKEAEAALRASEERFKLFMDHTPAQVWIDDEDGVNRFANPALARELGRPREEIIGRHLADLLPTGAPISKYLESNRRVLETGHAEAMTVPAPRHDGSFGHFLVTKFPIGATSDGCRQLGGVAIDVTEQHISAVQLRASEERFRMLVECVKDFAIYTLDLDGVIVTWNDAAAHMFGYAADEIIGQHRTVLFTREDNALGVPQHELEVAKTHGKANEERWRVRKDGSRFWSIGTMSALHDESGRIRGFVKVVRDLTERKQATDLLRVIQHRLELATKSAGMGIWDWNSTTGELVWDGRMFELYGVSAEGFSASHEGWRQAVHPEDRTRTEAELEAAVHGEGGFHAEFRVVWPNGEVRYLQAHGLAVRADEDSPTHVVGISWDITDRRVAEAGLRLRDKAIQAVSQGILITDPNQTDNPIIYASRGFEGMTGYTSLSSLGQNCRFLQGTDTDPATIAVMREAIAAGRECSVEILNYKRDGTPFWNALFLTPVQDDAGKVIHFVGVQADVTERRTMERAFHQAQKMEAIGQLTGGVAHDFNNLLTVILGNAELLIEDSPNDAQRPLLEMMVAAARSGSELTHRLLAFARKQILDPRPTDVHSLVRSLSGLLQRLLSDQVKSDIQPGAGPGLAFIDAAQLEGALLNLCINARDAMPQGGHLTLETANVVLDADYASRHAVKPGEYVMVSVSDSGVGIPREHLGRVFEPFFSTKEEGKGTGLGLAMVYGFVKQSGGHVSLYSEIGLGTTVKLFLPAASASTTAAATTAIELGQPLPGGSECVLLVEDEGLVRQFAASQLRALGYRVIEAGNGPGALDILRSDQRVDLLLTDVVMPGMNGNELAAEARQLRSGLRVLFTSGYTRDALVLDGKRISGVRLLSKPYGRASLARQVREALDDTGVLH